jgi:hypothetical protein
VRTQCELLDVPRSSLDYRPVGESEEDRDLMRLMDEICLSNRPVYWHAAAGEGAGARPRPEGQPQAAPEAAPGDGAGDNLASAAQPARLGIGASLHGRVALLGDERKLRRKFKFAWSRDGHSPLFNRAPRAV